MVYVVVPDWEEVHQLSGKVTPHAGLKARFSGQAHQGFFDSESAQKNLRWTDEQRIQVEEYLMNHPDFGHQIFFAPGQTTPDGKEPPDTTRPSEVRCGHFVTDRGEIRQCKNKALLGNDYCALHQPSLIKQGMLSAAD